MGIVAAEAEEKWQTICASHQQNMENERGDRNTVILDASQHIQIPNYKQLVWADEDRMRREKKKNENQQHKQQPNAWNSFVDFNECDVMSCGAHTKMNNYQLQITIRINVKDSVSFLFLLLFFAAQFTAFSQPYTTGYAT